MIETVRYQVFVRDVETDKIKITFNVYSLDDATRIASEEMTKIKDNGLNQYITVNKIVDSEILKYTV